MKHWAWVGWFLASGLGAQPVLDLATDPLLGVRPVHANVLLALSIEFPTVGAAYREDWRNYDPVRRYIGYFNAELCYHYNAGAERFEPVAAAAVDHSCSGQFSGNFMNWASMSAMDIFRLALTGGRRVVDEVDLTVLERAWIPTASSGSAPPLFPGVVDFYASDQYFPRRVVQSGLVGNNVAPVAPASVLPFAVARASLVSCRDEVLIGDYQGGVATCDQPGSDASFVAGDAPRRYKLRVLVCDSVDRGAGRANSYCRNFGDLARPSWKPVGEVQRGAESMRFGLFSYLIDQNASRYGGVLRHALDYVGARSYDSRFQDAGANPRREWDEAGRLLGNPVAATEGRSGFLRQLNDFGSVPGSEGAYKRFDPAGELFYEAVRYLQWHRDGPSAKAAAGLSPEMKGGFPVLTDWSRDPLMCPAQPAFLLVISDTNTWNDWEIPGNDRCAPADGDCGKDAPRAADAAYLLDVRAQTAVARDVAVARGLGGLPAPLQDARTGSGGSASYYLAGLAQYGRGDIRPAGARSGDANSVGTQQFTTLAIDVAEPSATPIASRQLNVAGVVGSASPVVSNYMLAANPERLVEVLRAAFSRVASTAGAAGGGALTASSLSAGGATVFVPYYDSAAWSGEVEAYRLQVDAGSGRVAIAPGRLWSAAAGVPAPSARQLWLGKPGGGARPLQWSELDAAEQAMFDTHPASGQRDGLGERRLGWLRGGRDDEALGRPLRPRASDSVLGDIVNAAPVHVAAPQGRYPVAGWEEFAAANSGRRKMLYVATNAGMVHGLDASSGAERFAAIPLALLPRLPALTDPGYRHHPLLDSPLVVGDAWLGSRWASLLVAGFGAGVQGLLALDVTDPDRFGGDAMLWEFTDADDADFGHVSGKPILAPVRLGSSFKWFAIVSAGYNAHAPDGRARADGDGFVFFLDPAKPAGAAWRLGSNYWKVRLPAASRTLAAGLGPVAAVFDIAGVATIVYAGDLQGQLWRIDLDAPDPSQWRVHHQAGGAPAPFFRATDAAGTPQPISVAPVIAHAPGGGALLFFGTGKMIERGDNAGPFGARQSFYGVRDDGLNTVARADLEPRRVAGTTVSGASFEYGAARRGWVLDLPEADQGEQQIASALLAFNSLFFNSLIPGSDPCLPGRSARYCLDPVTGLAAEACREQRGQPVDGFLSPPASLLVQSLDSSPDTTGRALRTSRFVLVEFATGRGVALGTAGSVPVSDGREARGAVRRIGWRELINWRELKAP